MDVMCCALAADEDDVMAIAASENPLKAWSGLELPGWDTVHVATAHSLLTGEALQPTLERYEPVAAGGEGETFVLQVADEMFAALLALTDDEARQTALAEELAAAEEFENAGIDAADLQEKLAEFAELAQLAESQDQMLFVWLSIRQD